MDEKTILKILYTAVMFFAIYKFMGGIKDYAHLRMQEGQIPTSSTAR